MRIRRKTKLSGKTQPTRNGRGVSFPALKRAVALLRFPLRPPASSGAAHAKVWIGGGS